ncbi:hypothetical protein [Flaviflagellibacter deserti]|uniref:Uncharacterized protein n=1 Tax=Flaviflagellibacter deserti TaxID=2267266 RepID=A0ABV9YZV2_9HYPH
MTNRPPPIPPEQRGKAGPKDADVKGASIHDKVEQTDNKKVDHFCSLVGPAIFP